jgi:transcriptional regulator with XRE-family HTH domain
VSTNVDGRRITLKPGEKMRKLRGKKPRRFVAKEIGVSYSSYMKYERNERTPSDSVKKRIAKFYGVSVESIFFK